MWLVLPNSICNQMHYLFTDGILLSTTILRSFCCIPIVPKSSRPETINLTHLFLRCRRSNWWRQQDVTKGPFWRSRERDSRWRMAIWVAKKSTLMFHRRRQRRHRRRRRRRHWRQIVYNNGHSVWERRKGEREIGEEQIEATVKRAKNLLHSNTSTRIIGY